MMRTTWLRVLWHGHAVWSIQGPPSFFVLLKDGGTAFLLSQIARSSGHSISEFPCGLYATGLVSVELFAGIEYLCSHARRARTAPNMEQKATAVGESSEMRTDLSEQHLCGQGVDAGDDLG
jgi:hypothetical protein